MGQLSAQGQGELQVDIRESAKTLVWEVTWPCVRTGTNSLWLEEPRGGKHQTEDREHGPQDSGVEKRLQRTEAAVFWSPRWTKSSIKAL